MHHPLVRWSWSFLCAGAALLQGCALPPADPGLIRVVSYNIRHGEGMDRTLDLERTAAVLRAQAPDVVALQEVDEGARRSGGVDQARELGRLLGMDHAFGSFMDFQGGRYGCAILTRRPIRSVQPVRLPDGHEPRVALCVEVEGPDGAALTFCCVHFDWVDDDTFRFAQAQAVAAHLDSLDHPYVVLGDFNDRPGSRTLALYARDTQPAWVTPTPTFPADAPTAPIDHLFAFPAARWRVEDASVVDERVASDHRPFLAVLRLLAP